MKKWDKIKALGMLLNGIGVFIKAILSVMKYKEQKRINRLMAKDFEDPMPWDFPDEKNVYYK